MVFLTRLTRHVSACRRGYQNSALDARANPTVDKQASVVDSGDFLWALVVGPCLILVGFAVWV